MLLPLLIVCSIPVANMDSPTQVKSPNGRNSIALEAIDGTLYYRVKRDGKDVVRTSRIGPIIQGKAAAPIRVLSVERGERRRPFQLPWSKTSEAVDHFHFAIIQLESPGLRWQVELRAYDDGAAFRYQAGAWGSSRTMDIAGEYTQFNVAGAPQALFNTLGSFTTSHESLYQRKPLSELPTGPLLDMPLTLRWPTGQAAAITEARVRDFAGGYLVRNKTAPDATIAANVSLGLRLAPLPARLEDGKERAGAKEPRAASDSHNDVAVRGSAPITSPWRVILLADRAGELLESNLLLCLNDPPEGDFSWLRPGKSTWHWWNGEFEADHKLPKDSNASLQRHQRYIDFCARHNIAYHAVSGDGFAWYRQSPTGYGRPAPDADVRAPRPEIRLFKIIDYARQRNVGIRLWVHWRALDKHLEEAFALYESWGVRGVMVDFLDRDDQQMLAFTQRLLDSAARHKLHVQIHGSSKFSGEQRTFPHLFNREGVLNLEYLKWSDLCTPAHNVNVAYTRGLTGPVDYHQGGFQSVPADQFQPRNRYPLVLGTRCHHLALYVVYENPMPMVCDAPSVYEGVAEASTEAKDGADRAAPGKRQSTQPTEATGASNHSGLDFIARVPTTWDETRFLAGELGEYVVVARRKGAAWYVGGITNDTARTIDVPLHRLGDVQSMEIYSDGSLDNSQPRLVRHTRSRLGDESETTQRVRLASGGGFVMIVK